MKSLILTRKDFVLLEYGFREWLGVLGYTENSVYGMPNYIHEFLAWLEQNGIMDIQSVTPDTVNAYFERLRNRVNLRRNGGLSNSYLNKHLQALKRFSTYLRETSSVSFAVEVRSEKQIRNIGDILTIKEVQLLFDATTDTEYGLRDRVMLGIYYGCGLRRNEGVQIDTDDILFDRKLIYVRKGKNYTERYVPIKNAIMQDIVEYINNGRPLLAKPKHGSNALLLSERGERLNGQSLLLRLKQLKEATADATLIQKKIGLHSLRHSIATHLLMQGMKLERIAQFLGHKSLESTQIYAHISAELEE